MEAVIVTGDRYPCEDAGAIRQHAIAKILEYLGYKVTVIGYGDSTGGQILEYDDVKYISFRPNTDHVFVRIVARGVFGGRALSLIKSKKEKVKVIVVVDVLPITFKRIEKYARKEKIKLVHDSVEWYSPEEFSNAENNLVYKLKNITNTKIIKNEWRVIAISTYLEKHFMTHCKKTIRIPVIMDIDKIKYRIEPIVREKILFSYVGGPGKKDYLKELIEGFLLLDEKNLSQLELHVIGVSYEQLNEICGIEQKKVEMSKRFLIAHGRLPHEEAVKWVVNSDYTLLLRDETLRYAKAGFPTKVVESLASATPVICNLSSDLSDYLQDKQNSVLIKGHSPKDVKKAVEIALSINAAENMEMRKSARKTAELFFDYKLYYDKMKELLD